MTRIMRDSITPNKIDKTGCQIAAGYDDGHVSQWPSTAWGEFPGLTMLHISALGNDLSADAYDVEVGNPTDVNSRDFSVTVNCVKTHKGSYLPILYANRSTLTPMFNALNAAGLYVAKHFLIWIATLDGTTAVKDMTGVFAVQYKNVDTGEWNYDESIVYDDAWKAPSKPVTPPPVSKEQAMLVQGLGARIVSSEDGGKTWQ